MPIRQRCQSIQKSRRPRFAKVFNSMKMTISENITAMTIPTATRGIAATSNFSTNAKNIPVAMTRATASVQARKSPPRVSCGFRSTVIFNTVSSVMSNTIT